MSKNRCKDIEWFILKHVNQTRRKKHMSSLKRNRGLTRVARSHSGRMASTGHIFHGDGPSIVRSALTIDSIGDFLGHLFSTYSSGGENCHMLPIGRVKGHGKIKSCKDVALAMHKDWM